MILSENLVNVPGKKYSVLVKCVSTRRLTTIEWLLLNCVRKFGKDNEMSDRHIKYAFEEVLQFQNSELLIKPCLTNLMNLRVIVVKNGINFDYNTLLFKDIIITEVGQHMLKEGLLPGEPRELGLDIYYNPLTGKMLHIDSPGKQNGNIITLGSESDYSEAFPEQRLIAELHAGALGSGRFTASKLRIEEIENRDSKSWDTTISMIAEVDDKGVITTKPGIIEDNVKGNIEELFVSAEIRKEVTASLPDLIDANIKSVIGSGNYIKQGVLDICKNGHLLFMNADYYDRYKRNTSYFADKTIILFNSKSDFSIDATKSLIIRIPEKFPVDHCVVVNDKSEQLCLGKKQYTYENMTVTVPLAVEDIRLENARNTVAEWLNQYIINNSRTDMRIAALYTLPLMNLKKKAFIDSLTKRWEDSELSIIADDVKRVSSACSSMQKNMFVIEGMADIVIEKIDVTDKEKTLQTVSDVMRCGVIENGSEAHRKLVAAIMRGTDQPDNYPDLYKTLMAVGITTRDDAVPFDDMAKEWYTESIASKVIAAIANGSYTPLPELFEFESFYNDYARSISRIELYLSGFKFFEKSDPALLSSTVEACPDIAMLQSYLSGLQEKNADLLKKNANIYDLLSSIEPEKADAYKANMSDLTRIIKALINNEYENDKAADIGSDGSVKKVIVFDTCALIHRPDIFAYLADDEYVRIPTKVIEELGKIKDKRSNKYDEAASETARIIAREIEQTYLQLFNIKSKIGFIIENASPELLPSGIDINTPDNQILSVALNYKDKDVCIVSDDGVFRLTAIPQKIETMTSEQFIESHGDYYYSIEGRIKKAKALNRAKPSAAPIPKAEEKTRAIAEEDTIPPLPIDDKSITALKKLNLNFNDGVLNYLHTNRIKTIGDFRRLTVEKVNGFQAKGKQLVYQNTIIKAIEQMDDIISTISNK